MRTCADFPGKEGCCDSCHDDEDGLWWDSDEQGDYVVCCARLRNMDDPD